MPRRLFCAALALIVLALPAWADDILVLKDGRRIPVTRMARRDGQVLFETTRGERFSVPESDVVSPPLDSIPLAGAPPPPAAPAETGTRVLELKDGRKIPVRQLVRRGREVMFETTRGERFSVPDTDVVSPPLETIPVISAPAPSPAPVPTPPPVVTPGAGGPVPPLPDLKPLGYAGGPTVSALDPPTAEFVPMPDRWRFGWPRYRRYNPPQKMPWVEGSAWDPYNQNLFKGDYPIGGNGVASSELFFNQNVVAGFEVFKGDTVFQPKDWAVRLTAVANTNFLADKGPASKDTSFKKGEGQVFPEELFVEKRLAVLGPNFDFASLRAGMQNFTSDFRGYVFTDNQLGLRLFGNAVENRYQYNVAWFAMRIREAASQLHTFDSRDQNVFIANLFVQDLFAQGYTFLVNVHYNRDHGFPGRGNVAAKPIDLKATYLGVHGDGRWGGWNVSHAFYQVFGTDGRRVASGGPELKINARMAALELSRDADWKRYRVSVLYASGDDDARDDKAKGFDMITDNPNLAGGAFSFWDQQGMAISGRAGGANVLLKDKFSLFPNLRNKFTDGSSFVNPGLILLNAGLDLRVSPKLKAVLNGSYLRLANATVLQQVTGNSAIDTGLGLDFNVGAKYRPLLNENVFFVAGASMFLPRGGLKTALQGDQSLHSFFLALQLAY